MKVCGIELKSNQVILTVLEKQDDDIVIYVDLKIKKISLEDDECNESVKVFFSQINTFLEENKIEKIFIKKRAKKGNFAGGPVTFKMEGLMQMNFICGVDLIPAATVNSYEKKNTIDFPSSLKKYQEGSYLTALCSF